MSDHASLRVQAEKFADDLTQTVRALVSDCDPFRSTALAIKDRERFGVLQEPDTGIPLTVDGEQLLTLKVNYYCTLDGHERYLAVDKSHVKVFAGSQASGEPLFRYDYLRHPYPDQPGAHLQIHAHRDAITHVMGRGGASTPRAKRRQRSDEVPHLEELHFPLGGPRFRPCLEDILEMLVCELGVDCDPAGRQALRDGRNYWRRQQVRSATRDAPEDAAKVLRGLGYTVHPPDDGHVQDNSDRLEAL